MEVKTKRISVVILLAMYTLFLVLGVSLFDKGTAFTSYADTEVAPSSVYYYDNLKDEAGNEYTLAKKFYNAFDELSKSGDFKDGIVNHPITDIVTSKEIEAWVVGGNLTIPKAFSAARDSYFYDHPELFYIDMYKLTISAGRTSGVYSAYIDCGLEANCYIDDGFSSETEVNEAIDAFNAKIDEIVRYVKTESDKDNYGTAEDALFARYANVYLAQNVKYDYEVYYAIVNDGATDYIKPYAGNAYGALILNECVCRGYSFAYKAVLDKLDIPCVVISGYSTGKNTDGSIVETGEAHSWNYVYLETPQEDELTPPQATVSLTDNNNVKEYAWYGYDVTWNSTGKNIDAYTNMSAFTTSKNHVSSPIVSSSGYNMPYPELSMRNYGTTTVESDFMHSYVYSPETGATDDYGNPRMTYKETVSYKGMSAVKLLDEGLHMVYRSYARNSKTGEMYWTAWYDIGTFQKRYLIDIIPDNGITTEIPAFYGCMYIQYAIVDIEPDLNYNPDDENHVTGDINFYYSKDNEEFGDHTIFISQLYNNKTFGTYTSAPYIKKSSPTHTGLLVINDNMADENGMVADKYTFTLNVTYDEPLHVLDESKPIGITFVTEYANIYKHAKLVPMSGDDVFVTLSEDKHTLTFKFKPSLMYEHDRILYSFYFTNIGSSKIVTKVEDGILTTGTSNKAPNPVYYHFARYYTACNQILGGGRLWIDCCAQPTLVSNSDLAAMDFKDEEGNSTFSEQARSQMMLVVNSVKPETENEMLDTIDKDFGIKENDIKASETYDINLQICGKFPTITDGSYVKIALGFPQGYGPEDEGVIFKLYHRKHISGDEYIIEEVPCVVTQFGIVATVTSFSPYMVAAVDASKASANKTIYASIDGKGGKLSLADGQIRSLKSGESYTYTITPDDGYKIHRVMLNGTDVTANVGSDGKLTVSYDNLLYNNELKIQYISNEAAQRYETNNIELVNSVNVVVSTDGSASIAKPADKLPVNQITPDVDNNNTNGDNNNNTNGDNNNNTNSGNSNTTIIVVCVVVVAVVAIVGIALAIVFRRKRVR